MIFPLILGWIRIRAYGLLYSNAQEHLGDEDFLTLPPFALSWIAHFPLTGILLPKAPFPCWCGIPNGLGHLSDTFQPTAKTQSPYDES